MLVCLQRGGASTSLTSAEEAVPMEVVTQVGTVAEQRKKMVENANPMGRAQEEKKATKKGGKKNDVVQYMEVEETHVKETVSAL